MVQWSSGRQRSLDPSSPAGAERWPRCPISAPTSRRSCSGTSAAAGSGSASTPPPPRLGLGMLIRMLRNHLKFRSHNNKLLLGLG